MRVRRQYAVIVLRVNITNAAVMIVNVQNLVIPECASLSLQ
jgi:hypothetical protein